jgi:urease accessory protein UreF
MADLSGAVDDYSRSSGSANSAADTTNKLLEGQQTLVGGLTTKLKAQTAELDNATAAVTTYVDSLAKQITQGFDLGTGFEMKDGAVDAAQWIAGVNSEVDKLTWYGNVLKRIKEEGGQGLADYLAAQGVEQGALYGQALIDTGLITTMADKLSTVQTQANLVAQAMVPEFLLAGQDSAEEFVNGTITQIALEEKRLRKIGQAIGQPIGANIKAEIAQAVAEAIRAAEAAGTAARAEVSARETARQVQLTEQATAQSLARLIRQSDQRAGVGVRPVLT